MKQRSAVRSQRSAPRWWFPIVVVWAAALFLAALIAACVLCSGCRPSEDPIAVVDDAADYAAAASRFRDLVEPQLLPPPEDCETGDSADIVTPGDDAGKKHSGDDAGSEHSGDDAGSEHSRQPADLEISVCPCLDGGPCACEAHGCACLCGPKPEHDIYKRLPAFCVVVFHDDGERTGECARLRAVGWNVRSIDLRDDPRACKQCGVEEFPTFVCLRHGTECGRSTGDDWSRVCAMLRQANALRFPPGETQ